MPTTTDVRVNDLIINKMTQEQYDALPEKSFTELYVIEGDSNIIYAEQAVELPTASENNLGRLFQYIGITDQNYTNGYFYKCVSDGLDPATYSWQQVDLQPAVDPLPDQTGQSGKFLTTDGTNASWSDKIKITNNESSVYLGTTGINLWGNTVADVVVIGKNAKADVGGSIIVGSGAYSYGASAFNEIIIGTNSHTGVLAHEDVIVCNKASTSEAASFAVIVGGYGNSVTVPYAMQFGGLNITNSEQGTIKFATYYNGAWQNNKLMDADGTIPEARLADMTNATQGQVLQLDSNNNAIWADVDSLPSQSGQNGKILGTDGTNAAWETKTTVSFRTWGVNE